MLEKFKLFDDLHRTKTLLNCLEGSLICATLGNMNDDAVESFDLLYLLMDHVGRMVDEADDRGPGGKEGAA